MDCAGIPQKTSVLVDLVCEEMNGDASSGQRQGTLEERPNATKKEDGIAVINEMIGDAAPIQRSSAVRGGDVANTDHITPHLANLQAGFGARHYRPAKRNTKGVVPVGDALCFSGTSRAIGSRPPHNG